MSAAFTVGGFYNWKHQPERLVYLGMGPPRNGPWHQFAKVESPGKVWCEVLDEDLQMLEETPATRKAGASDKGETTNDE